MARESGPSPEEMGLTPEEVETSPEKKSTPIKLSREEFDTLRDARPGLQDPKRLEVMEKRGIEFDSGIITLEVDGEEIKMTTETGDFGTALDKPEDQPEKAKKEDIS